MSSSARRELAVTKAIALLHKMLGPDIDYIISVRDPTAPADELDSATRLGGDPTWIAATLLVALKQFTEYAEAVCELEAATRQ
jgi:hypothetical protein